MGVRLETDWYIEQLKLKQGHCWPPWLTILMFYCCQSFNEDYSMQNETAKEFIQCHTIHSIGLFNALTDKRNLFIL